MDTSNKHNRRKAMTHVSTTEVRRSLLRGAIALFGLAAGSAGQARNAPRARRRSRDEVLYEQAWYFVEQQFEQQGDVIAGPVSLLQRRFGLDYGHALALAGQLEQAQTWSVFRDGAGMRCARRQWPV
jgi:hypothetical protein